MPWLDVFRYGCGTAKQSIVGRLITTPSQSVGSGSGARGVPPGAMLKLIELFALPPANLGETA
jgi:hypothetical protein